MRLVFFVEGQTEQEYVARVLAPHLARFGVYADRPTLPITGRKRGKTFKGGGDRFAGRPRTHFENLLKEHTGDGVRFTTMFDLYGLYPDFPGTDEAAQHAADPYQRVAVLEAAFAAEFGDPQVIPHIQLHEFETLLFCDPGLSAYLLDDTADAVAAWRAAAAGGPELVNDVPATSPSHRIKAFVPDFDRLKTTVGVEWAEAVGLAPARALCKHFDAWITTLESLGTPPATA